MGKSMTALGEPTIVVEGESIALTMAGDTLENGSMVSLRARASLLGEYFLSCTCTMSCCCCALLFAQVLTFYMCFRPDGSTYDGECKNGLKHGKGESSSLDMSTVVAFVVVAGQVFSPNAKERTLGEMARCTLEHFGMVNSMAQVR